MRKTLFFEPLDVLQFRDHRPFDAGFHVLSRSTFPMPSVFLGCVRTALLRAHGADFRSKEPDFGVKAQWARELLGTRDAPGTLGLRGPLLARVARDERDRETVEPLFPAPRDVAWLPPRPARPTDGAAPTDGPAPADGPPRPTGGAAPRRCRLLRAWDLGALASEGLAPRRLRWTGKRLTAVEDALPWTSEPPEKEADDVLFTRHGAERYLAATPEQQLELSVEDARDRAAADLVPASRVYQLETRVGIAREPGTLAVRDRMFYVLRPFRLARDTGFAVDVEAPGPEAERALDALDGAIVPLGGKAHRARIRLFPGPLLPPALALEGDEPRAPGEKVWLLTPLPLRDDGVAWPPGVTCLGTGRAALVGGFDLARRAPKPLRRALPAGTVLAVRGLGAAQALAALGGERFEEDRRAGYGAALRTRLSTEGAERR